MDFNIVKRQIISEYLSIHGSECAGEMWSLEDCLNVFRYFYRAYKEKTGTDHPKLSNKTINWIIQAFPYIDESSSYMQVYDIDPGAYSVLIDAYFRQRFDNCNYSIAHFMSGDIRALRYYEELY